MDPATNSTSSGLLRSVMSGDRVAWDRFANLYVPLVYHWARLAGLQETDGRDVCQNVFVSVLQKLGSFRSHEPGSTLRGWLRTITHNAVIDLLRKQGRQTPVIDPAHPAWNDATQSSSGSLGSAVTERQLLVRRAAEIVRREVEPKTWEIFERFAIDGRPAEEVAQEKNISIWAVYKARSRVLAKLRVTLSDDV